jgi:hypothetical protein
MLSGYGEQMMGYVGRLAARSLNKVDVVRPRTASIFEPQSPESVFILRRNMLPKPSEYEDESQGISPKRYSYQPSADLSLVEKPKELSARTFRSDSIIQQEVQHLTSPERMSDGYLSGDDSFSEFAREYSPYALEEKSQETPTKTLRPNSIIQQGIQPLTSSVEMSDESLSEANSSWVPVRENHKGIRMGVLEIISEVVPQAKTGSTNEETAQSRHVLRPLVSKLPVHCERNDPIYPNAEPRRRIISAMLETTEIQSSKYDPLMPQEFAHRSSTGSEPVIHVTIGRVEVRASQKPHLQEKRNEARNVLTLEEYLRRPRGRG